MTSAASSATHPFTAGLGFKKGDAPVSVTTDLSAYQVQVLRRWNDGSVKHAVISGRADLSTGVAKTVGVFVGTAPTGTALTASSIQSASPAASVRCGSIGTVSLVNLLGSPVRTFISGPEMVECHYRADVGGGTLLSAWFHVRLYADGRVWVRAIVENGYLDNGSGALASNTTQSYVPTITVGAGTVFSNGGSTLSHYDNTRYMAEGWIGTDPQITPLVDVAYLRSTRLVPNHATAPTASALSGLTVTYTPMSRGPQSADMGSTGYQPAIGLLPNWNAAFIASGSAAAFKATLVGSSSLNSFGIVWRSKASNRVPRPTDFPTWTALSGPAGGNGTDNLSRGGITWERNHAPGEGYLAYLLTGDYWHYETIALQASLLYLSLQGNRGNGTSRIFDTGQTRGMAWSLRTVGLLAAIAPDSEMASGGIGADYRALLATNYSSLQSEISGGASMVYTGSLYQALYGQWPTASSGGATVGGTLAAWMTDFFVATNGFLSDLEPLSTATALTAVRDHMYKWVVGRLGPAGDSNAFNFTQAGQYGIRVASTNSDSSWYASWGAIWQNSMGSANSTASNTLTGGNFPGMDSYWGNLLPAIAYAVDHGATGAAAGYARLTGATNWSDLLANFGTVPVWAVKPRS